MHRSEEAEMLNGKKTTMVVGAAALVLVSIDVAFGQTYYGSQVMSPGERAEHRAMMRSLPPSEREAYRAKHHEEMKERAESMGLPWPEQPPADRGYGRRGPVYGGPGYTGIVAEIPFAGGPVMAHGAIGDAMGRAMAVGVIQPCRRHERRLIISRQVRQVSPTV
jgi:hypothetical protein